MYYCALDQKHTSIIDTVFHYKYCCCHHAHLWYYQMSEQDDHIRAYYEHLGWIKVHYDTTVGISYEYPAGLNKMLQMNWPYHRVHMDNKTCLDINSVLKRDLLTDIRYLELVQAARRRG